MEEFIKTTLRSEKTLYRRLKATCAEKGITVETAINQGIQMWLQAGGALALPQPQAPSPRSREELQEAARFADFLAHGDAGQVELVKHALELHARKQRAERKRGSA